MAHVTARTTTPPLQTPQDTSGDPYFLVNEPIVERLFAPSRAPFGRDVAKPLAQLQEFLEEPRAGNIQVAHEGAKKLCGLLERMSIRHVVGGRGWFRRDYALATLQQVGTVFPCEESVQTLQRMLTDDVTGRSNTLSESIMAGVTDLNEYRCARLRRTYAREGGLCDTLAERFAQAVRVTNETRSQYQRKTSRHFDGSVPESQIRAAIDPIIARAREALVLVPAGRMLVPRFEERVESVMARLGDYHFADASRLMEGLVNDMREMKSVFQAVEGLDKGLGSRADLARTRRSPRSNNRSQ